MSDQFFKTMGQRRARPRPLQPGQPTPQTPTANVARPAGSPPIQPPGVPQPAPGTGQSSGPRPLFVGGPMMNPDGTFAGPQGPQTQPTPQGGPRPTARPAPGPSANPFGGAPSPQAPPFQPPQMGQVARPAGSPPFAPPGMQSAALPQGAPPIQPTNASTFPGVDPAEELKKKQSILTGGAR